MAELDLDGLRAFLAVVDRGGFTAAADAIGRTQSAVSVKIRKLEDTAGRSLLHRDAHRVMLTPEGEMLLGPARRIVAEADAALARLRGLEPVGVVRLGLGELFVPDHLPGVLVQFRKAWPGVRLEVKVGLAPDLLADLRAGRLDLVVANREGDEVEGRIIWSEPLCWVAAKEHDVLSHEPVPLVALGEPCLYRHLAIERLAAIGRGAEIVYTCSSLSAVEGAIAVGAGLAVLGRSSLRRNANLRDVSRELAPLPDCDIAVFGETRTISHPAAMLVQTIEASLGQAGPVK